MAELKQANGRTVIDYMARDAGSFLQSMRALIPEKLPEWTDYESEADFGNVLLELFAHMGDILSYYQDRVANESFLGTAQERRSIIQHLRLIGYTLSTAAPAAATLTLSVPISATDVITIRRGDAFATKGQKDKPSVRFEYTREQPLTINCPTLPVDPATNRKFHVGIPVEEGRLIKEEILGTSAGTANQRYKLTHAKMILRSLGHGQTVNRDFILSTELGQTRDEWTLRETLAFSREGQKDFAIEIDEEDRATVMFGDGVLGAIPAPGSIIKVSYRVGGGSQGNAAANTIQTIIDAPQLALVGAQVTNPGAATGGAERESIEHAVSHAPQVFRSLKRAVTAQDYEALALDFKGVGKVRAEGTNWNVVTLFVAPAGGGHVSDVLEANLLAYFEDKRPISTIMEIEDVDYVPIYVTAAVGVKSYYLREDVKEHVQQAVSKLLAFEHVTFQQTVYLSKFYEAIEAIDGVAFVNISEFRREDQPADLVDPSGKIELGAHEIPTVPSDDPAYTAGLRVELEEGELTMRFLDLVAVPHPSGNRIDLSWVHPNPTQFPGVRVVRREHTHPLSPTPTSAQHGVVVADTSPTSPSHNQIQVRGDGRYSAIDLGLKGETVYYYGLFPHAGNPPTYDIDRHNRAVAMATAPYNIAGQMADLLPALYHRYDTATINAATVAPADRQKGQLGRFLDLPGGQLDLLYSFARAMRNLHDLEKVDSRLLVLLAQWIGWQIDHRLETDVQRNNVRNAPHLYKSIGLIPTLEATVKRLVGWESRSKEFVHNVFRSNQPERLNLWVREQSTAGAWSTPTAPLSLDFAYEGRPCAVRDQDGVLWLFYHTLRKGRWDIWHKKFRDDQGWTPSEPLTNRTLIDKYPTAVLQATTLRVFWSTYYEADQRWQINFRSRSTGQWSPITPLSALAPFATGDNSRRQPWAVTDNAGMLWLFWLELAGQQWQLRYNRYDGTNWTLAVPATFPVDAGADPRVESPPFVVFHPTDAAQRLWVFWTRTEPVGASGQQRWRIVYRVKTSLNPSAADWSAIRALPPGPAESQDREPAALVKTNGDVELYWSSTRSGSRSVWRATVNRATHAWGPAEMLINSPYTQCDPLPVSIAAGTMLVYHANESVRYTSSVYRATETVDHRYAGSTTLDVRNAAKRALWGSFGDFQTFTSDLGENGERTNADQCARETVGLYLTPDTTDQAVIQRNQSLLRNALREFFAGFGAAGVHY